MREWAIYFSFAPEWSATLTLTDYGRVARDPSEIVCSDIPQNPGLAILLNEFGAASSRNF
jgi:hypothetical protein